MSIVRITLTNIIIIKNLFYYFFFICREEQANRSRRDEPFYLWTNIRDPADSAASRTSGEAEATPGPSGAETTAPADASDAAAPSSSNPSFSNTPGANNSTNNTTNSSNSNYSDTSQRPAGRRFGRSTRSGAADGRSSFEFYRCRSRSWTSRARTELASESQQNPGLSHSESDSNISSTVATLDRESPTTHARDNPTRNDRDNPSSHDRDNPISHDIENPGQQSDSDQPSTVTATRPRYNTLIPTERQSDRLEAATLINLRRQRRSAWESGHASHWRRIEQRQRRDIIPPGAAHTAHLGRVPDTPPPTAGGSDPQNSAGSSSNAAGGSGDGGGSMETEVAESSRPTLLRASPCTNIPPVASHSGMNAALTCMIFIVK